MCYYKLSDNTSEICSKRPLPNHYSLQSGCWFMDNREAEEEDTSIDLGRCPKTQCLSKGSSEDCHYVPSDSDTCCEAARMEVVTRLVYCVHYQSKKNISFTVVTECACQTCSGKLATISGHVTGDRNGAPLQYIDVVRKKRIVAITNAQGYYTFSFSQLHQPDPRVVLSFNDPSGTHLSMTKTVDVQTLKFCTIR